MSIGNTEKYLDWARAQDDDSYRDSQEVYRYMTEAERKEYNAWLDSLSGDKNEPDRNKQSEHF